MWKKGGRQRGQQIEHMASHESGSPGAFLGGTEPVPGVPCSPAAGGLQYRRIPLPVARGDGRGTARDVEKDQVRGAWVRFWNWPKG